MASITFNNCNIQIGQQVNEGGTGYYYASGQPSPEPLPSVLSTPQAMELWKKAQEQGWIDKDYQLLITKQHASLLADYIGRTLQLEERWKPFEKLWHIGTMRKDFDKAMGSPNNNAFIDKINEALK